MTAGTGQESLRDRAHRAGGYAYSTGGGVDEVVDAVLAEVGEPAALLEALWRGYSDLYKTPEGCDPYNEGAADALDEAMQVLQRTYGGGRDG